MIEVTAGYFEVIDSCYNIPVQAIVFVFASVGVLADAEDLALPVDMLYRNSDSGLLSVVLLLLLGERVLLACLEGQH